MEQEGKQEGNCIFEQGQETVRDALSFPSTQSRFKKTTLNSANVHFRRLELEAAASDRREKFLHWRHRDQLESG